MVFLFFVNVHSSLAIETFQMGKIHKDIAMFMTEAAKDEEYSEQMLIKVKYCNMFCRHACFTGKYTAVSVLHTVSLQGRIWFLEIFCKFSKIVKSFLNNLEELSKSSRVF